ncbi:hypothetical protein DWQ65_01635 [Treponema phagedenis]|uniref:Uncharacterized protein n=1 Tax=Treponema phagedenis TaxID=162 RepID=A0A0B7GZ07_TREPH|nr:hypothetical protein FUT79_01420 [Treponema phagedenis]QEJ97057.1 hypothetical protein FUT82_03025 [Treponema phagedenis]QEK01990.1 hypothetical protein FUT84_13005 [Treponema phagedenis]QEK02967.1 hypothetical protein FUT83_03505 [Treponema phagedenis]QEK07104.1 hypothetical protein FUT80_10485 [Treponema phagedenis]
MDKETYSFRNTRIARAILALDNNSCQFSIAMVSYSPLLNSKRCFKASTQNCKIEALKLVGEVTVNFQNFAVAPCRALFKNQSIRE